MGLQDLEFRIEGLGFKAQDLRFRVGGLRLRDF